MRSTFYCERSQSSSGFTFIPLSGWFFLHACYLQTIVTSIYMHRISAKNLRTVLVLYNMTSTPDRSGSNPLRSPLPPLVIAKTQTNTEWQYSLPRNGKKQNYMAYWKIANTSFQLIVFFCEKGKPNHKTSQYDLF